MPKRTFWLTAGLAVGAGSSLWVERRVRRAVEEATARLRPDALAMELGRSARGAAEVASARVHQAVAIGRDQMRRTEQDLWAQLAPDGRGERDERRDGSRDESRGERDERRDGSRDGSRGERDEGLDGSRGERPDGHRDGRRGERRRTPGRLAPPVPVP